MFEDEEILDSATDSRISSSKYKLSRTELRRLRKGFREAIQKRDKSIFERAIRETGQQPGSLEYARSLMVWNEYWKTQK